MDRVNSPSHVGHELPNEEDLLNWSYYMDKEDFDDSNTK